MRFISVTTGLVCMAVSSIVWAAPAVYFFDKAGKVTGKAVVQKDVKKDKASVSEMVLVNDNNDESVVKGRATVVAVPTSVVEQKSLKVGSYPASATVADTAGKKDQARVSPMIQASEYSVVSDDVVESKSLLSWLDSVFKKDSAVEKATHLSAPAIVAERWDQAGWWGCSTPVTEMAVEHEQLRYRRAEFGYPSELSLGASKMSPRVARHSEWMLSNLPFYFESWIQGLKPRWNIVAKKTSSRVAIRDAESGSWVYQEGELLRDVLARWSLQAGWHEPVWLDTTRGCKLPLCTPAESFRMEENFKRDDGDFIERISRLFSGLPANINRELFVEETAKQIVVVEPEL